MENSSAGSLSQRLQEYIAKAVSQGYPNEIFSDARSENDIVLAMGVHMKNQYLALNYPASVFDSCTTPVEIKNAATAYREALVQERAEAEQKRLAHAANLARATVEQERLANPTKPVTPIPLATAMAQPESQPGAKYRKVKVDWLGINQEKIVGTYAIFFFALLLIYGLDYFVKFDDHTLRMLQIPVWVCVTGTSFFIVYKLASPTYINIQTHRPQSPPLTPTPEPTPALKMSTAQTKEELILDKEKNIELDIRAIKADENLLRAQRSVQLNELDDNISYAQKLGTYKNLVDKLSRTPTALPKQERPKRLTQNEVDIKLNALLLEESQKISECISNGFDKNGEQVKAIESLYEKKRQDLLTGYI